MMDFKQVVRDGYDTISHNYRDDQGGGMTSDYAGWLAKLAPLLALGTPVLDLGCGCGVPAAQILSHDFEVTGVDISPVQIRRAMQLVPEARFISADMAEVDFPPGSFGAIVSFYAIIHLPLKEQPALFANLYRWLRPGGYLMVIVGHEAWTGTEDYLGAPMYWSHADAQTYQAWLTDVGFHILWTRFIPEGDSGHALILARRK